MRIDSSAIVYPHVTFGEGALVEAFAIVGIHDRFHPESTTVIGCDAFIGSRCTVYSNVIAGDRFDISDQTTVFTDNRFGDDCRIGPKAVIKNGCRLGNRVRVNANTFLERVETGDDVFIGPGTVFTDDPHPPCPRYAECRPKTRIGSFVSIGAGVVIAPGVNIGHHTQIYAGAVVLGDVAPYSVMAGNPARCIKDFRQLSCTAGHFDHPFAWWDAKDGR